MLKQSETRGITWAAAVTLGLAASVSWWSVVDRGEGWADVVPAICLTVAALISLANVALARAGAKADEGDSL